MKTKFLWMLFCIFATNANSQNRFSFSPVQPKAGDEVTVKYNASRTPLEEAKSVYLSAYFYSAGCNNYQSVYDTRGYEMKKNGGSWYCKLKIDSVVDFIGITFTEGDIKDDNLTNGYFIRLYDESGNESLKSQLAYGTALIDWGRFFLSTDVPKGYEILSKIFLEHPDMKANYMNCYAQAIKTINKSNPEPELTKILGEWLEQSNLTNDNYKSIANFYKTLNMKDKAKEVKGIGIRKYPRGTLSYWAEGDSLSSCKTIETAIERVKWIIKEYPPVEKYYVGWELRLVEILLDSNRVDEARNFVDFIKQSNLFNYRSAGSLAKSFFDSGKDLNYAQKLAQECEVLNEKELNATTFAYPKSNINTEKSNKQEIETDYGCTQLIYAKLLTKLDKKTEAVSKYEKSFTLTPIKLVQDADVAEYLKLLSETKKYDNAQSVIEKMVLAGFEANKFKDVLSAAYKKKTGSINEFDNYWKGLEKKGADIRVEKQSKIMINQPAPQFILTDLDGKQVSLSDYKGKVVILDFWATWCGPCRASFPMMQKAVNKYKNDPNVVFFFIDTRQTEKDKKKVAQDFIDQSKYTFHVLLDVEDKVLNAYKISGIPTKIVIDKKGNIKFNLVGFSGSDEVAVEELSGMITLAGN